MKILCLFLFLGLAGLAVMPLRADGIDPAPKLGKKIVPKPGKKIVVAFPDFPLRNGERIVSFSVTVTTGQVHAIANIPPDWSVHLNADISWKPVVSGGCHHGAGALTAMRTIPSLTVEPHAQQFKTQPPFNMEATVDTTVDFEAVKTRSFSISELKLTAAGT